VRDRNRPETGDLGPGMKDGLDQQQPSSSAIAEVEQGETVQALLRREQRCGITIPFCRPRIEPERDGWGWLVLLPSGHAWLAGDRRAALTEFAELERIERGSPS
jgi:hypothetical protein